MGEDNQFGKRLHPDFYYGLVLLVVGVGLLWHTAHDRYDFDLLFGDVSTVFFPRIILILWIGLATVLIVNGMRGLGSQEDLGRVFFHRITGSVPCLGRDHCLCRNALADRVARWWNVYNGRRRIGAWLSAVGTSSANKRCTAGCRLVRSRPRGQDQFAIRNSVELTSCWPTSRTRSP